MIRKDVTPELQAALQEHAPDRAEALAALWRQLGEIPPEPPPAEAPDDAAAWNELARRLDQPRRRRVDRYPVRQQRRTWIAAVATLVVAAIGLAVWAHSPVVIETSAGEIEEVALPDGSALHVAPASVVRYPRAFRSWPFRTAAERLVELEGEAFFSVAAGERPFIVITLDAEIEVLGTSFNVRSRPGEQSGSTVVTVEEGQVHVRGRHHPAEVVASGGEAWRIFDGEVVPAASALAGQAGVWRLGGFTIHEMPLEDVLREVERRFRVAVSAAPGVSTDIPLTLFYRRAVDAETVIHDIALATDLQYRPLRGGFELVRPSTRQP